MSLDEQHRKNSKLYLAPNDTVHKMPLQIETGGFHFKHNTITFPTKVPAITLNIVKFFIFRFFNLVLSQKNPVYYKIFCGLLSCIKCMICASTSPYRFEKFKYIVKIHAQNFAGIFTVLNICMPFIYNAVFTLKQVFQIVLDMHDKKHTRL